MPLANRWCILIAIFFALPAGASDKCAQTAHMDIYSSAFVHTDTGDIDGYELAIKKADNSAADALLYVYEGAPNLDGIPLSGRISGAQIVLKGSWVEHLIDEPSHKEVFETHRVEVNGMLDARSFRGQVRIEGLVTPNNVRLKRVEHIWMCKQNPR
jgi:hypothetical protein